MSWLEVRLDTTHEAIDWVRTLLVGAIEPQDLHVTNYLEAESLDSDLSNKESQESMAWEFTIFLYLPEDGRSRTRLDHLEQILAPLYRTGLTTEMQVAIVEEKLITPDTLRQSVGEKFSIVFSKSDLEADSELAAGRIPLIIEPSLAFGSGLHPATMLSLQMLERYVLPGMHTLDLGSGSGILSVAMAKLGATVLALDNDPIAVQATQEAIDLNQVSAQVVVQAGSLGNGNNLGHWLGGEIADSVNQGFNQGFNQDFNQVPTIDNQGNNQANHQGKFNLVMANIFARIHIALATDYCQVLQQDNPSNNSDQNINQGILITTGFTKDQEDDVIIACQDAGFKLLDRLYQDQWVALVFQT
jgi:ribosomal protein L11 methyltransferase